MATASVTPVTSQSVLRDRLKLYFAKEGQTRAKSTIAVFELPFSIEEQEILSIFVNRFGKVKRVEMYAIFSQENIDPILQCTITNAHIFMCSY